MHIITSTLEGYGKGGHGSTMEAARAQELACKLLRQDSAYDWHDGGPIPCVDPRVDGAGLAGGVLSLALMYQMEFGGRKLSHTCKELWCNGFDLYLHAPCAAMDRGMDVIKQQMTSPDSDLYDLAIAMGLGPIDVRQRAAVARWAEELPCDFIDVEAAMRNLKRFEKCVTGETDRELLTASTVVLHTAARDVSADAMSLMALESDGYRPITFATWMADYAFQPLITNPERRKIAVLVAHLFTLGVIRTLGSPEMQMVQVRP